MLVYFSDKKISMTLSAPWFSSASVPVLILVSFITLAEKISAGIALQLAAANGMDVILITEPVESSSLISDASLPMTLNAMSAAVQAAGVLMAPFE